MRNRKIGDKVVIAIEELEQLRELARECARYEADHGGDRGYVVIEGGLARWFSYLPKAAVCNPGAVLVTFGSGELIRIATGEGPALNAEEWSEVLISKITLRDLRIADILDSGVHSYTKVAAMLSKETGLEIGSQDIVKAQGRLFGAGYRIKEPIQTVGSDPAAMERDPESEQEAGGQKSEVRGRAEQEVASFFTKCLAKDVDMARNAVEAGWVSAFLKTTKAQLLDIGGFASEDERAWFLEFLRDIAAERPYKEHFDIVWRKGEGWWIIPAAETCTEDRLISEDGSDDEFIIAHARVMDEMLEEEKVAATLAELPENSGEAQARGRCEAEGREYARGRLDAGATVAEIRRNMIEPNPYPSRTPERVWWGWGLLEVLTEAEAQWEEVPVPSDVVSPW